MRISKLNIENFRSIESVELELPRLCALVGPNNAGKSNIMLALHRVLGGDWAPRASTFDDAADRHQRDPNRDIEITITVDPPLEYKRFKFAAPVKVASLRFTVCRYKVGDEAGDPRMVQECIAPSGKPVQVMKEAPKKGVKPDFEPLIGIPREVRNQLPLIYIKADRRLRDQLPAARYSVLRSLFEDIDEDFRDAANQVTVARPGGPPVEMPRNERWQQLMKAAMDLLRTKEFADLESDINRNALRQLGFNPDVDDDFALAFAPPESIDFYKDLDLQVTEGQLTMDATELGQGFQNAVFLAILEAYEKRRKAGAVFLIEEPEISLHPQPQRALYRTLISISEDNQVIYTTHSPHFVGIPDYKSVRLIRRESGATTAQASKLAPSDENYERLLREVDPERSELFFARRLLLVEGDTEKLALPEYARRLELDLDRAGASIVEVGGKGKLEPLAELADSFGIPTGILYDLDSSDLTDKPDGEKALNDRLAARDKPGSDKRSWGLDPKYEAVLGETLGEEEYPRLCQEHAGPGKATPLRRIAAAETAIPKLVEEALRWLGDSSSEPTE